MNAPRPDREVILRAVRRADSGKAFLHETLRDEFERTDFPYERRRLVAETAADLIRRKITLDHLIAAFSDRPPAKLNPDLKDILRLAAYEVVFLDNVPVHASVDEAVALTRRRASAKLAGFANAVLRNLARSIEKSVMIRGAFRPSPRELWTAPGRIVRFKRPLFPDPKEDSVGYLSVTGGMPRWLVERWWQRFGGRKTARLVEAANSPSGQTIRVNRLKTTPERLIGELQEADIRTWPGPVENSLRVVSSALLTETEAFRAGRFYIQDPSSMRAVVVLAPRAGEKILDLCAGPGGKATQIAELADDHAEIFAIDHSEERLLLVEENARRLGIRGIRTAVGDARKPPERLRGTFDAVLADVPCSNTAVLRRRVEARHRLTPEALSKLAEAQAQLLTAALVMARPGGRVVYSTCSIEPEEDGELVHRVLDRSPSWRLDLEETVLPEPEGPDGAYIARLVT